MDKRVKQIADYYGEGSQLIQLVEEMAELTQAITKYLKDGTQENWKQICEEMADTEIMLKQGEYLLNGFELVGEYYEKKVKRQLDRIEKLKPVKMIAGVHNFSPGSKRYYWRVPDGMEIMKNQLVKVSTCKGASLAAVLKIFSLPEEEAKAYKPVLEVLQPEGNENRD